MIYLNQIKCIEVEEIENLPKIKLKSVNEFLELIKTLKKPIIYRYEDVFFIVDSGAMYYIPAEGFKTLEDLINAKNLGLNAEEYYEYIEFSDMEEYKNTNPLDFHQLKIIRKPKNLDLLLGLRGLLKKV